MIILNFTHPLTATQRQQVEALTQQSITQVLGELTTFDQGAALAPQITALVERVGLTAKDWQSLPILVNLPGHAAAAACLLAELHGRMGHFPAILRVRPVAGNAVTQFEVAEIINLQVLRDTARTQRFTGKEDANEVAAHAG
ncbi:MAG: CRISPR-associated protein Csx15 [Caldilineaceae bacterium]